MPNDRMPIPPALANNPIAKSLAALWDQSGNGTSDLFTELAKQVAASQSEAGTAKTALAGAVASPIPQTDPAIQAIMASLGNAASGLTGSAMPSEHAKSLIETDTKNLQQKRLDSIDQLSKAYQRAADRAEKMGDTETEIKFREKLAKQHEERGALLSMMNTTLEGTLANQRQDRALTAERTLQIGLATSHGIQAQQLQSMNDTSNERVAYIQQGLDPDDPTKALTHSKAQRVRDAVNTGFVSAKDWAIRMAKITDESSKKGLLGTVKYDTGRLRNLALNSLPPDLSYATSPKQYVDVLLSLHDPEDKTGTKFLFPRDPRNPNMPTKAWEDRIRAYVQRWWPGYNPDVEAIGNVGK